MSFDTTPQIEILDKPLSTRKAAESGAVVRAHNQKGEWGGATAEEAEAMDYLNSSCKTATGIRRCQNRWHASSALYKANEARHIIVPIQHGGAPNMGISVRHFHTAH